MQAVLASESGALTGAVVVSSIAVTTDKDLAPAAGTEVVAGTAQHRHAKADEGWIYTCSGATLWTGCVKARLGHGVGSDYQIEADAMPVSSALS